jgi:hypothetical protein
MAPSKGGRDPKADSIYPHDICRTKAHLSHAGGTADMRAWSRWNMPCESKGRRISWLAHMPTLPSSAKLD